MGRKALFSRISLHTGLNLALNSQFLGGRDAFLPSPSQASLICLFPFFPVLPPVLWLVQVAGDGPVIRAPAGFIRRDLGQMPDGPFYAALRGPGASPEKARAACAASESRRPLGP